MTAKTSKPWYQLIRWRTPKGEAVACDDKIKVLNENLKEIEAQCQDAFEDAVLMGCDEKQIRETLSRIVAELKNPYKAAD
jgi:uncharacterized protein (UPF0335 family)